MSPPPALARMAGFAISSIRGWIRVDLSAFFNCDVVPAAYDWFLTISWDRSSLYYQPSSFVFFFVSCKNLVRPKQKVTRRIGLCFLFSWLFPSCLIIVIIVLFDIFRSLKICRSTALKWSRSRLLRLLNCYIFSRGEEGNTELTPRVRWSGPGDRLVTILFPEKKKKNGILWDRTIIVSLKGS